MATAVTWRRVAISAAVVIACLIGPAWLLLRSTPAARHTTQSLLLRPAEPTRPAAPRALFAIDVTGTESASRMPTLVGIVGRVGQTRAMLRMPDGSVRVAGQGETVAGWRIAAIGADRIRLTRGREQRSEILPAVSD